MMQQHKAHVSFFPMPQSDELLDSVVYRYHQLAGHASPRQTFNELFGKFCQVVPKLMTNHTSHLLAKVPPHLFKERQDILAKHLLLPALHRIFGENHIKQAILNTESGARFGTDRIYYCCHTLLLQHSLQCCPLCIQEEQNEMGFAYWHRSHQLHGVATCHKHGCDLIQNCPYCGRQARHPRSMELPESHCLGCGKRWLPTYSFSESVNRLANLAYVTCNSGKMEGTDLVLFAKVVSAITGGNTAAACNDMEASYGSAYFKSIYQKEKDVRGDWLKDAFHREKFNRGEFGPWTLRFRRYSDLLMAVDNLFGSWADFDRYAVNYRKTAA
ncbi:TniQ family protein [Sulfurirhabdus autotrophica]|uniref:TniQ protein n=1 Tax=Sulfurirhabdus autotrophica TaxID=1706046 RepID=A0A4R3XSP1_9PROT|nr:TniQ family protein [Sulfurirhabdus autotrophica]TCV81068.1 TniQ protein [Sulfurirhabdus autotrophica]